MRAVIVSVCAFLVLGPVLLGQQYPHIAPTDPKTPAEELKTFKVPDGFEVQLIAADPDIHKPIQIAFDAKGRLWATTSEEYPHPAVGRPGKDRLYVMEDFGPNGKAKKITVFADDLNIPIGVLPLPDCKSVIVSSIEQGNKREDLQCWIWKLTDTDGDGKADKKEKLYGPFGCRDTHGMNNSYTLMPDGWVYACHGFLNDSKPKGKDGHEITMNSGNTFRFRPDGSRIEIWTRGQVNPFGIAVDPYFNLYTADCHSKPITQLIRGATYQSFAKPHDGLGFAPHVTVHGHDSTALCGLVYYAADHFPKEYLDHMFLGNVTSNCINLDKIEFKGSTPVAIDKGQFLSSSDLWCRPTDIKLGPDGALYWADFYNKIIGHYEVGLDHPGRDKRLGRVWRIVSKGKDGKGEAPKVPDLTTAPIKDVFAALGSPNLTSRLLAGSQLPQRPGKEVAAFVEELSKKGVLPSSLYTSSNEGMVHEWWHLTAVNGEKPGLATFRAGNLVGLRKAHPLQIVHELHLVAMLSNWKQDKDALYDLREQVHIMLDHSSSAVQRAAVETLSAHPDPRSIRPLIGVLFLTKSIDNHLIQAVKVALRETVRSLEDWDQANGKSAWTADQAKVLADIAPAVPTPAASQFIIKHFSELGDTSRLPEYVQHATRYAADDVATARIVSLIGSYKPDDQRASLQLFQAFQRGSQQRGSNILGNKDVLSLADKLCFSAIKSTDAGIMQGGIDIAVYFRFMSAFGPLAEIAEKKEASDAQRLAALGGLGGLDAVPAVPILVKFLNDSASSFAVREKAAQSLAQLNRPEAQNELIKALTAAPARLQTVIALGMASNAGAAEKMLAAIKEGKASARLLQDNTVQQRLRESRVPQANERIAELTKGLPTADQKMLGLMKQRSAAFAKTKPDAMLGKAVFTKTCAICHQIGNEGTKIGPQLDGIGGRGLDRLLEDILDPNRNVDAAFRQTTLVLKDGKSVPGLLLREEGQIVVMADDKGKEVRVPKDDIEEKRISLLSAMPANISEALPEKDFYDLMAYLLTQRAKP